MSEPSLHQRPTSGHIAETYAEVMRIITHPAFRIGFIDAQHGRPFDHERIMARIVAETPPRALERIGWKWLATADDPASDLLTSAAMDWARQYEVELAQYRYEEGRLCVIDLGLKYRAWGHPDFPPKALQDLAWERHEKSKGKADPLKEAARASA